LGEAGHKRLLVLIQDELVEGGLGALAYEDRDQDCPGQTDEEKSHG